MKRSKNGFWPNLALLVVFTAAPHLFSLWKPALYSPMILFLFMGLTLLGGLIFYVLYHYLLIACFERQCLFFDLKALFPAQAFAKRFMIAKMLRLLAVRLGFLLADQFLSEFANANAWEYYYAVMILLEALQWIAIFALILGKSEGKKIAFGGGLALLLGLGFLAIELVLIGQFHQVSFQLATANDGATIFELTRKLEQGKLISTLLNMGYDLLLGVGLFILNRKIKAR